MADETQVVETPVEEATQTIEEQTVQVEQDKTKHEFDELGRKARELEASLREERLRREALETSFKALQPKSELPPIVDPDTGLVNGDLLTQLQRQTLEAQERARKAEESVQTYLTEQENKMAYDAHPDLNPNGKEFDRELNKKARALILDSMLNPQDYDGRQLSLREAGDYLKGSSKAVEAARVEGAKQALEQLTPKEQATLEATGTSGRRSDIDNLDALRAQTRRGNLDAVVERMRRIKTQA